jgi:hypothetical protein
MQQTARFCLPVLAVSFFLPAQAPALEVQFDYSYDHAGLFDDPQRRAVLETAADLFAGISDPLEAIDPGGGNHWTLEFNDPHTGNTVQLADQTIPASTIRIYVGGTDVFGANSSTLAFGGPGGYSVPPSSLSWIHRVSTRGQDGADGPNPTDFAPWGGKIFFNSLKSWSFTTGQPVSGSNDMLSVVAHEIGHVLGYGTSDSWRRHVLVDENGLVFLGPNSVDAFAGDIDLEPDEAHWLDGTSSSLGQEVQETAMDPTILVGSRKLFTRLDRAGLLDIGWRFGLEGDVDLDGRVDQSDLDVLTASLTSSDPTVRTWLDGDSDGDGDVDFRDFVRLSNRFGTTAVYTGQPAVPEVVPEPAVLALLGAGIAAWTGRRRLSCQRI